MTLPTTVHIPSDGGQIALTLCAGSVTLIAGANGAGKSALLYQLYKAAPQGEVTYYPGHRQITFNNGWDNLQQDLQQMTVNLYRSHDAFSRYKGAWAEDQFKSIVRQFQNLETEYNRDIVERIRNDDTAAEKLAKSKSGPINQLNGIFAAAGMQVSFSLDRVGLLVKRGEHHYRIDQMSDGERAAFFLSAAIITQSPGTIIMIDEPERHLHPSISGPLVQAAVRTRDDIAFLFATHDLHFLEYMSDSQIIHVANSRITNPAPEQRSYTAAVINSTEILPEGVKVDLLGARQNVLFVEGTKSSIDREIYARIYSEWKVTPRGGWEKCVEAVRALSSSETLHWVKACAIIDADGKSGAQIAALEAEGIFTLPSPTIENILLLEDVIRGVSLALHLVNGPSPDERIAHVQSQLSDELAAHAEEMAARQTVWKVTNLLNERKLSVQDVRDGVASVDAIDVLAIKAASSASVTAAMSNKNPLTSLRYLPIKNSSIPARISTWLGAGTFKQYSEIVLRQLDLDSEAGHAIRGALITALPTVKAAG